jgi:hypothetical protein
MSFERIGGSAANSTRSLRCRIPAVGVVLIALVFGVSLASAAPLEEAADTARSVVPPVTETSAPSLPSAPPAPAIPPAPVATPTAPPVPANQAPAKVPTRVTPASLPSSHLEPTPSGSATHVSGPVADSPPIGRTTSAANASAGRLTSPSSEGAQQVAVPARNDAGAGSDSRSGASPRAPTSGVGVARSVEAALPRWFAYVWPAIALGQTRQVFAALLARREHATSRPVSDVARSLFQLRGITGNDDVSTISEQSATPNSPPPYVGSAPRGGGMSLFLTMVTSLLALIGLIALARLAVGEEFFSFLRWPQ